MSTALRSTFSHIPTIVCQQPLGFLDHVLKNSKNKLLLQSALCMHSITELENRRNKKIAMKHCAYPHYCGANSPWVIWIMFVRIQKINCTFCHLHVHSIAELGNHRKNEETMKDCAYPHYCGANSPWVIWIMLVRIQRTSKNCPQCCGACAELENHRNKEKTNRKIAHIPTNVVPTAPGFL